MLEFFRKNLFFNSLLLLPYTCIVRIYSLIYPRAYQLNSDEGYVNQLIFTYLNDKPLIQSIIGIALVFFQASYINFIVNKNRIATSPNLFPGVAYVVLASILPSFQVLNPILIALTFLLISIDSLFRCASKFSSSGNIFNVSFFISLASMIYFPCWILIFAGYISLVTIRSFKIKERIQYIIGGVIPFFLFSTYYNWNEVLGKYMSSYLSENATASNLTKGFNNYQIIVVSGFVCLALFSFFKYNDYRKKKNVASQKKIDILYWFLIFSLPMLFFWKNLELIHFLVLVPSLSVFFGMFFLDLKNRGFAEIIHVVAIVLIWITQFQFAGL